MEMLLLLHVFALVTTSDSSLGFRHISLLIRPLFAKQVCRAPVEFAYITCHVQEHASCPYCLNAGMPDTFR